MPRPSAYTPARRLLLQAVLLLILIGAVGLAKVVTRYKLRAAVVKLAPPVRFDDLSVSLPAGWSITFPPAASPAGPRLVRATEPAPDAAGLPGRVLTVARDHTDIPLPPLEYLLTSRLMPADYAPSLGGVGHLAPPATTPVDGQPGFLVAGLRPVRAATGQVLPKKEVFATAMLPSRDVVTVRLEGLGQDLTDDLDLVRQIAASVSLPSSAAAAPSTGPVTLPNGSTVKPPPGFVTLPEPDPHLTERHLLRAAPPTRYADLTLVPCVFFPDSDDQDTFRTMLAVRDTEWLDARITAPSKSVLRADLPLRAGLPFPRRAYLLTAPTGHALLVELHAGSPADAADFDALLKQVADSATPPAGPKPTDLLAAGAAEVHRLRDLTLPSLLQGAPADSWWLWTFAGRPAGWSHLSFEPGDPSHGTIDDHTRAAAGVTVAVRYAFETSPDLARHNDSTLRRAITPAGDAVDQFREDTTLTDGKYALVIMTNPATGQLARAVRPAPDAFLPGPWLPLLTPKLSRQDMILRTTRLPGLEAAAITAPLTVRLHPTTRPATFDVDVSGTGQVMTLSPTAMQLSNTTARTHTTPADLQKIFPQDPAFSPKH